MEESNPGPLAGIVLENSGQAISNSVGHSQRPWLGAPWLRHSGEPEVTSATGMQSKTLIRRCHFFSKCHIYNFYWSVMTDSE